MVRRWHGREFKLEAVRLVREGGAPAAQIARDLGIHPHLLHKWTKEFEADPDGRSLRPRNDRPRLWNSPSSMRDAVIYVRPVIYGEVSPE